jgi:uncharacterized protein (DUF58 family)
MMNRPVVGWSLAIAAVVAGYWSYGWPGLVLALTAIVFWLLLQFSRAMRVMRKAGNAPLGQVGSAVMLNAKLRPGMTMLEILPLTGSLGAVVGDAADETFRWHDAGGAGVRMHLKNGRLQSWQLEREDAAASDR